MLIYVALASAGVWSVCSATESTSSANGGWTIVEARDSDGGVDVDRGTYSASSSVVRRFSARREEDLCKASDGVGGATRRWTAGMISIDSLPVGGSCNASIWADGYVDAGSRATVSPAELAGSVVAHSVTKAEAANTGDISVDGGGGSSFSATWAWSVAGRNAEVDGTVVVDSQSAYNGASLEIPGWAWVQAYDGEVDAWVRRGSTWEHVTGTAPLSIEFGAITAARGEVCAQATATAASSARVGETAAGGSGIHFTMDTVRSSDTVDVRPAGGPTFAPCGCD